MGNNSSATSSSACSSPVDVAVSLLLVSSRASIFFHATPYLDVVDTHTALWASPSYISPFFSHLLPFLFTSTAEEGPGQYDAQTPHLFQYYKSIPCCCCCCCCGGLYLYQLRLGFVGLSTIEVGRVRLANGRPAVTTNRLESLPLWFA